MNNILLLLSCCRL